MEIENVLHAKKGGMEDNAFPVIFIILNPTFRVQLPTG